ncbi:B-cell receptor CD22-like isoform X3 [Oreochromis aureus]|uniref:B-cell receptor CD22-like isoform X3 n=1 Tax=Oreochromis aureus TaxID=47969 RepID=UPI001952DE74|nr:B-cell receptor CD22-like isoform X3 [Oreochromis aureus]
MKEISKFYAKITFLSFLDSLRFRLNIIFVEEKVPQEKDSFKLHFFATKMAATLTFLLISSLLQGALCGTFNVSMPQNINVLRGSCVTIPCSFDVDSRFEKYLDDTCKAYWNDSPSFTSENAKLKPTKEITGDLTKKDCTTTFNNASLLQRSKYYFRLECDNALKYSFKQAGVDISLIDDPPSLTLTPSTLEVKEGTSVSLTCSAPAPCWSHPPALTWSPNLGQSQETLQENQDKTKVKTSVMSFTASHLHHGNKISCTAVYQKQDGSPDVTAETSLTPDISYSPKNITVSVSPSGPVPENSNVSLTCSSNANPAVRNYTWYRADGDQETFIGTGTSLNIQVSRDTQSFFCNAENEIGVGRSSSIQIDVQYSPKNITVSVSPSGPVPENSNVSLTCSSNANPAVRNYTWYRADGDHESLIGTGTSLNIKVSRDRRTFFCNAENEIGVGRSSSIQIDVQYSPKNITVSVSPSGPVPENSNVSLTCSSNANPAVRNYTWYRADGDQETLIGTGTSLNIQVLRNRWTFFCKAENEIGVGRSSSIQIDVQWSEIYYGLYSGVVRWVLAGVFFSVSVICAACLCKLRKNVKPKEEDRTYMTLSGRTVSSSEYDVINTAPKSQ